MRIVRIVPLALLAFGLAFSAPARAGEVDSKNIHKDAKWYLHLDLDAFKKTTTYATLMDAVRAELPIDEVVQQVKAAVGVNPLTDISGITVYNTSFEKDVAAIIFHAKIDQFMLQQALANNPEYKQEAYAKHSIQTWTDPNDGKHKAACFVGDGAVVMGNNADTVKMAVDVFDGAKPGGAAIVKAPAKGAFLYGSAYLGETDNKQFARLMSATEPTTATIGEDDNKLQIAVSIAAKTAEQAKQVKQLLDGLKALAQIQVGQEAPTAAGLLNEVKTTLDGAKVLASVQQDAKTLVETVKKLNEERKALQAKKAAAAAEPAPAKTEPKK